MHPIETSLLKPQLQPAPSPEVDSIWQALYRSAQDIAATSLSDLFEADDRTSNFSIENAGWLFDYSKNHITEDIRQQLVTLAEQSDLGGWIDRQFNGCAINMTENRKALHTLLRRPNNGSCDEADLVDATLQKIETFVNDIHCGEWCGFSGKPITDVVNIGIGGSDLGPLMVTEALKPYRHERIRTHFVSNVDSTHLTQALETLSPETTIFIIASKTFTTLETMTNAHSAKAWYFRNGGNDEGVGRHFVAVSANVELAQNFGIAASAIFPIWDWVGGRYSLWSAIGLPIALSIGMENFRKLLAGAHAMDEHYRTTDFEKNIPVIMSLLNIWYINFFGAQSYAVIPYNQQLLYLTQYLQQLDMESNGKSTTIHGTHAGHQTGSVLWGGVGTNTQHSFHQLFHQGTLLIPVDFIVAARSHNPMSDHQRYLFANCLAQARALMIGRDDTQITRELEACGKSAEEISALLPHKRIAGNRPSNLFITEKLTPSSLGALIAMHEHRVFTSSVIWQINAFDQWGVELGKQLSGPISAALAGDDAALAGDDNGSARFDASTRQAIDAFRRYQSWGR